MIDLTNVLRRNKKVALDSMIFIYYFEDHQKYAADCEKIFTSISRGKNIGTTSLMTYLEIINLPTKHGRDDLVADYENIIGHYPNLFTQNLNFEILNDCSRLINEFDIHTLDAIQIATAKYFGATAFITNDKALKKVKTDIQIVCLNEVV